MSAIKDLTGMAFGKLKVIGRGDPPTMAGSTMWQCVCECGVEKTYRSWDLRYGKVLSCGCHKAEAIGGRRRVHGDSNSKLYNVWSAMRRRCLSPSCKDYQDYGARGITICEEWDDYIAFKKWALDNGYKAGVSIDRINNDLGYRPDNCRFVGLRTQANNKRNNSLITACGKTMTLAQWSRHTGINRTTISARINIYGWSLDEAVSIKAGGRRA